MKPTKNLVFTVTHGRTGTTMLTEVFKMFDDTLSEHEPEPNYATVFPAVKDDPRHAFGFLEKKLAHIDGIAPSSYVETSNVFGKGFLIPLLRLGLRPGLIFLNREFRETAKSLYKRGSTPMRTERGRHYSADPRVPGSLPVFSPEQLSDYQLCFWGVLDSYYRQLMARDIYDAEGGVYHWVTATDFHDFETTLEVGRKFGLGVKDIEAARAFHASVTQEHHNPNRGGRSADGMELTAQEVEVLDRVSFFAPGFVDDVLGSRFIDQGVVDAIHGGAES
ncbi:MULTISPECIES: hypothetical protein [Halomonas]|uniref:Sulfotransferase family protein n=2 Tax=Halomonas TaxID=2745 RepID=A0ABQ0U6A6_9GAMM|nr:MULTISPECIES: hypothetical protein [Halomonas]PSJ22553.1 hypothetical protein CVH10_05540 [Halomonas sp. ND22Bw]KGE77681.1 hypothetical protein FP66_08300 [Halomonas salina]MDR5889031.1 hypothetical protein [Halomonas salina]WJY07408.1 hypothetical protein QWG60_00475 [Halomonas halophila]GEK74048.1 hypothetical protein HHA04nite_25920 [Halomonas halophila]